MVVCQCRWRQGNIKFHEPKVSHHVISNKKKDTEYNSIILKIVK